MQGIEQLEKFQDFVSDIGGLGRFEDTYIVHAAEGETVVPMEVLDKNPVLKNRLFETMRDMGIQPERYVVGSEFNSINPLTGQPEFFLKKVFRRLRKAKQDIGRRLRKFAADSSGYVAPIVGAMYGPLAGSLAGGILGQYKRENPGDKNQALQMAIRGGISGLTSNLAQGQNLLTGRGLSGGNIGGPGSFRSPMKIGREMLGLDNQVADAGNITDSNFQNASFTNEADALKAYNEMNAGFEPIGTEQPYRLMQADFSAPTGVDTGTINVPNIGTDLGTGTGPFDSYVQQGLDRVTPLPKEGFFESLGYEGSRANLNPLNIVKNILKNPTPNDIENMMNYQRLVKGGMNKNVALETIQNLYKLTPAKASAIAGAVTYGTQLIMDKMGGDDDDDDGSSAGYEINPILEGIFSGGSSGDVYYDYPPAYAAEGGIMDLQNGGESKGPGTGTSDSIPAMLSDGEFVMTAKAVRGAGGGDRREGARKMYQMMDKLERSA
jgi:hypothetical protein